MSTDTSTITATAISKKNATKIITEGIPDAIITPTAPVLLPTTAEETTAPTVRTVLAARAFLTITAALSSTSPSTTATSTTPTPTAEAPPAPLHPPPPTMASNPPAAAAAPPPSSTTWHQRTLTLPCRGRGAHLITQDLEARVPEIRGYRIGLLHVFAQHTSCALSLNENWDADVRLDMADALDRIVPEEGSGVGENLRGLGSGRSGSGSGSGSGKEAKGRKGAGQQELYRHSCEGADDMPAHVKSALIGASVSVPISEGKLAMGTWQGVYLLEFRNGKQSRRLVTTLQGERY